MNIYKEREGSILKVKIKGSVDAVTAPELDKAIENEIPDITDVLMDCKDMDYISSAGLRVILKTYQSLLGKGGKVVIEHVKSELMYIFEDTGFIKFIEIR
ncbi:STAS domain-containing protein [Butyrivibrio sp. LC3010]|uniref:STAS domain-containing protein n=1 Tax=Butyrivibrio sp. LC3010 TaxID=1280680 RepID=UPI00041948D0|nr:STAS domain-containing protein [Butyrivibrio sp. LC3010]